jgi:hypothetical protein
MLGERSVEFGTKHQQERTPFYFVCGANRAAATVRHEDYPAQHE